MKALALHENNFFPLLDNAATLSSFNGSDPQPLPSEQQESPRPRRSCTGISFSRDGSSLLPDVSGWLGRLSRQGWRQAIASAAPRANIETVLEVLSAAHIFQAIVSAEDVNKGKPDPEVYLLAAERLGTAPACCIVIEDAVAGIEGARAAGMRSIGVSHNGKHLPADVVVGSLDLLDAAIFDTLLQNGIPPVVNGEPAHNCH
jgi:beta-phosphoglucomutase-like phosphatase (HAD superfamily)